MKFQLNFLSQNFHLMLCGAAVVLSDKHPLITLQSVLTLFDRVNLSPTFLDDMFYIMTLGGKICKKIVKQFAVKNCSEERPGSIVTKTLKNGILIPKSTSKESHFNTDFKYISFIKFSLTHQKLRA